MSDPSAATSAASLRVALDATLGLVHAVRPDQWSLPTPCPDWTVADLAAHVVAGNRLFAAALIGAAPPAGRAVDALQLPGAYDESGQELLQAFGGDGVLDRPVTVPFGTVPGAVALHLRVTELLVHGWDLAIATGQRLDVPDEVVRPELAFTSDALQRVPADRSPFAPPQPVPADATEVEKLAALLGRSITR